MRRLIRTLMLVMACVCMATPSVDAQRHQGAGGQRREATRSHQSAPSRQRQSAASRPSQSSRPSQTARPAQTSPNRGNSSTMTRRPGATHKEQSATTQAPSVKPNRPNNGGGNGRPNNGRPGIGNGGGNNRPGGNGGNQGYNPGNNRPGHGGNNGYNPGHGGNRPGHNVGHNPGHGGHRPPMVQPPHRPHRPPMMRPHHRPVPPPMWRPGRIPVLRGILGLTFGTGISVSLNYLYNNGYTVDGYTNDMVYLRNAPALNYIWTDAALYYGANGLDVSSFYYSTPGYDLARYNACYNTLVATYGMPVALDGMTATWFGGNRGYVTLSFGSGAAGRFLTTLTFGM